MLPLKAFDKSRVASLLEEDVLSVDSDVDEHEEDVLLESPEVPMYWASHTGQLSARYRPAQLRQITQQRYRLDRDWSRREA